MARAAFVVPPPWSARALRGRTAAATLLRRHPHRGRLPVAPARSTQPARLPCADGMTMASAAEAAFVDAVTTAAAELAAPMGLEVHSVTWARGKLGVLVRTPDQDADVDSEDDELGQGDDEFEDDEDVNLADEAEAAADGVDDAAWDTADLGDAEEIDLGVEDADAGALPEDDIDDDNDAGGHGASLRQCQRLSTALEALLDGGAIPVPADAYTLEVGTPGAPSVLTRDFEFEVFKSFPVTVRTTEVWRKADRFSGTLHSRTEAAVVLNLKGRLLKIPRELVAEVRLPKAGEEP